MSDTMSLSSWEVQPLTEMSEADPVVHLLMERGGVQITARLVLIGLDPTAVAPGTISIESGQDWRVRKITQ